MTTIIEPLAASNIADLDPLFKAVYNRPAAANYFQKKYAPVYEGRPPLGFLAYAVNASGEKMPVAFYGVLPCLVFSGNRKVRAAQSADAMTHPGFRRRGLFLQLARLAMNACSASGTRLLFGFPNQNSLPGFLQKLGWEKGERMDCFRLPVRGIPIMKIVRRLGITGSLYRRYSEYILNRNEPRDWKPTDRDVPAGMLRDEAWVKQKRGTGMRQLKLEQTTCWIRRGEELLVGDVSGKPLSITGDLARLKHIARQLGLSAVQFHCCRGTALHRSLMKEIAPVPSFTIIFKDFGSGIAPGDLKFTLADIDTF